MRKNHKDPKQLDLTKPRCVLQAKSMEGTQDMYWIQQLGQRKGLKLYQTRSNTVILYDTLPAYCVSTPIDMKSEEKIYQKVYVSPRPPPTISYKDNWMCDLDSHIAGSSKDIQRIELKPRVPRTVTLQGDLVQNGEQKPWIVPSFIATLCNQENHDKVTDTTSTETRRSSTSCRLAHRQNVTVTIHSAKITRIAKGLQDDSRIG